MQLGCFRLGMHMIKSALAVFLCILFSHLTQRGIPMITTLSAVFSLRQDLTTTISFGKSRIVGNTLGGTSAIIYFFVKGYFHNDFLVGLTLPPILVIIVIVVLDGINNNSGIISAVTTLLLVALNIPQGESALCAIQRVLDAFIGTFIAIGINFFLCSPETEKKEELSEDLVELQKRGRLLKTNLQEVEAEIQKQKKNSEDQFSFAIK